MALPPPLAPLALVLAAGSAPGPHGLVDTATAAGGEPVLGLALELTAIAIDQELPGHPTLHGRGHLGAIAAARLRWRVDPHLTIEAGALGRLPFSLDPGEEAGALPILALVLAPLGAGDPVSLELRFGSLFTRHGFHPALADEARYAYARPYAETYLRSLAPGVERDVGDDPFLPAEHGAQLRLETAALSGRAHADVFLDWQLLETRAHREKFLFGAVVGFEHRFVTLSLQLRLAHYGGELFTRVDPVRFAGDDPVRQPTSLAAAAELRPLRLWSGRITFALPLAIVRGKVIQAPGEAPAWHQGFEVGAGVELFHTARIGWRWWLPEGRPHGFVSEDGDAVYAGRRSHCVTFALSTRHGAAELSGRLDLISAEGAEKLQYETATSLSFSFDPILWSQRTDGERR